jgi:hypothetical protein
MTHWGIVSAAVSPSHLGSLSVRIFMHVCVQGGSILRSQIHLAKSVRPGDAADDSLAVVVEDAYGTASTKAVGCMTLNDLCRCITKERNLRPCPPQDGFGLSTPRGAEGGGATPGNPGRRRQRKRRKQLCTRPAANTPSPAGRGLDTHTSIAGEAWSTGGQVLGGVLTGSIPPVACP